MSNYKFYSLTISLFILISCGGSGGGDESNPTTVTPQPKVESLSMSISLERLLFEGDPVVIELYAHYDDQTQVKIFNEASFELSSPDIGDIEFTDDAILFDPGAIGVTSVTANYSGQSTSINVEVINDFIQFSEETTILPLGSQIPLLRNAVHYTYSLPDEPNYDIFEVVDYHSSNPEIADFVTKDDGIILNPSRNYEVGHINALSLGTAVLTFSYLNISKTIEVEVAPHRLITSHFEQVDKLPFNTVIYDNFDMAIGSNLDSFFLSGVTQLHQILKLSHYSKAEGKWQADLDIQLPQTQTNGSNAKLIVGDERIVVTWPSVNIGYVAIIDKVTNEYEVVEIDGATRIEAIAIDSQNRIVACWNIDNGANCKIENDGNGWSETQTLPARINQPQSSQIELPLSNSDEFFIVSSEVFTDGRTVLNGMRFKILDTQIQMLSNDEIYNDFNIKSVYEFCPNMVVSKVGEMACYFIDLAVAAENLKALYTVYYSLDKGWVVEEHFGGDDQRLSADQDAVRVGINDSGDMLLMWRNTVLGAMVTKEYTPATGWGVTSLIESVGAATPYIEHAPIYTTAGWTTFLAYARAKVTKTNSGWVAQSVKGFGDKDDPFNETNQILGTSSYRNFIAIAPDGNMGILWRGVWAYFDAYTGYMYNNPLYFALPVL